MWMRLSGQTAGIMGWLVRRRGKDAQMQDSMRERTLPRDITPMTRPAAGEVWLGVFET